MASKRRASAKPQRKIRARKRVPAAFTREPPVIADTATSLPPGAVLIDAAEERVLLEVPFESIADVPRGTSEDFAPLGLTEVPVRPRWWIGTVVTLIILASVWFVQSRR